MESIGALCFTADMTKTPASRDHYHHGNLPESLMAEGAALLAEVGVAGFSLRKVAARAGVSAGAPSQHFGSAKGLLTAIATAGFRRLSQRMEAAATGGTGPEAEVAAMCRAYVQFARDDPGPAAVMFRLDVLDPSEAAFRAQAFAAFDGLSAAIARAVPGDVAPDQITRGTRVLWAAMQGLVALPMIDAAEAEETIDFAVRTLLAGMRQS